MASNNLHDVEDYSNEETTHDQLPSVEEAISNMGTSPRKESSFSKRKMIMAGLGAFVLFLVIIIPVARKNSSPYVTNVEAAVHRMALDSSTDFDDETSYQSKAKAYLVEDDFVQGTYTYAQLKQRYAMYCLYHATSPDSWSTATGWKRKGMSECEWHGVTCDGIWVTRIEIEGNGLAGEIPEETTLIPRLSTFNVNQNNDLEGAIPDGLCDNSELEVRANCEVVDCDCCANC
eukprot:Nitzschia sp. Nitz4//scaffold151_size53849//24103//24798//NITZ4_006722-RA/size53849-processed-gene-0.71-mRNA-1//-1//CDS//3329537141//2549//frame0